MELKDAKNNDLLNELFERFDHCVVYLVKDGEGAFHARRWKGNYLACLAMCDIVHSFILEAYRATMKLLSKETIGP